MDANISKEELDIFLNEAGILKRPLEIQEAEAAKEESVEKLLEEIIGEVRPTVAQPHPASDDKIPHFLYEKEQKKPRFRFLPLGLSIALLGGIFLGTIFGFYWGQSRKETPIATSFEAIESKLGLLVSEIQAIHEKIIPFSPPHEMIEPLEPLEQLEELSASKLS